MDSETTTRDRIRAVLGDWSMDAVAREQVRFKLGEATACLDDLAERIDRALFGEAIEGEFVPGTIEDAVSPGDALAELEAEVRRLHHWFPAIELLAEVSREFPRLRALLKPDAGPEGDGPWKT